MFSLFEGAVMINMYGFPEDWSIKSLCNWEDRPSTIKERLAAIGYQSNIKTLVAPRPLEFNARILALGENGGSEQMKCIQCQNESWCVNLCVPKKPFEGIVIPKTLRENGFASYFYTADCAILILHDQKSGRTIATHAGRDSLIDRSYIEKGSENRRYKSVVDAAIACFEEKMRPNLHAFICGAIPKEFFGHDLHDPACGLRNQHLCRFLEKTYPDAITVENNMLFICLRTLIRLQLIRHGIHPSAISADGINTVSDRENGEYMWHSHRRATCFTERVNYGKRNGTLVYRP